MDVAGDIRRLAHDLRRQAADLRSLAARLLGEAEAVPWQGLAAEAMRRVVRERGAALLRAADAHDRAAGALEAHAGEVGRVAGLLGAVADGARELLTAGPRAWHAWR